eukprot:scaffold183_cov535-Pavlova_lutheri.AAC.6
MKTDDGVGAKAAAPAAITVAATATVSARLAWPLRGQLARQVQEGRPAASVPSVGHRRAWLTPSRRGPCALRRERRGGASAALAPRRRWRGAGSCGGRSARARVGCQGGLSACRWAALGQAATRTGRVRGRQADVRSGAENAGEALARARFAPGGQAITNRWVARLFGGAEGSKDSELGRLIGDERHCCPALYLEALDVQASGKFPAASPASVERRTEVAPVPPLATPSSR